MLPSARDDEWQVVAASGARSALIAGRWVHPGASVSGTVARTGQPLLHNGPVCADRADSERYCGGSYISVPVPLHDGRCGVLNVADPVDGGPFLPAHLATLQDFATYIARDLDDLPAEQRVQQFQETVRKLQRRVIRAQEDERQRLARELHDEASHALTRAMFRLDFRALGLAATDSATQSILAAVREELVECANALHGIAFALRPRILEDLGLGAALRSLIAQHNADGAPPITLTLAGWDQRLDEETELAVFRVVQEALTNVRKHAQATVVTVALQLRTRDLRLVIEDDGIGLVRRGSTPRSRQGQGVGGMRERVEALGGTLTLTGRKGLYAGCGVAPAARKKGAVMSATPIRVLLIEDHEIVREGLALILQQSPDIAIAGLAADGESGVSLALRLAARDEVDVIVTDLGLPDIGGPEVIRRIKARYPHLRILILSMYSDDEHVRGMLECGADGYQLKHSSVRNLSAAVRAVASGETSLAPVVARRMMTQIQQSRDRATHGVEHLTAREREVLRLIATGETTKSIARHYGCQPKTVENHRGRILAKLGVNNTPAAITLAFQRGLISADAGQR